MEQKWFVICTRNRSERKVISALNKKGIENFCPFTIIERKNVSRSSKEYGPLFSSCIFVKTEADNLQKISRLAFVVNPLYWKTEPAIISNEEINAIKTMCENYSTVRLEKTAVKTNEKISVIEKNITGYNNHTVTVQHQGISVTLPSLGYTLSAEREKNENAVVHKKTNKKTFAGRLNLLSFLGINL